MGFNSAFKGLKKKTEIFLLPFFHHHNSYVVIRRIVTLQIITQFMCVESAFPKVSLWQLHKDGIFYVIYCP